MKPILRGEAASGGKSTGKVKKILSPGDNSKMQMGEILVTLMTNPQYLPAIMKASGIITEIGGILSHAAIVSREFGIPCVVGAKGATEILKDGMEVTVDGSEGTVFKTN